MIAERNTHFTFIISSSKDFISSLNNNWSTNVILMEYCPQMQILQKAKLMVTHAGGSIKECIRFGVPMVCYPVDNDQFGNAARVAYHGLGKVVNFLEDDDLQIEENIKAVLSDSTIKDKLKYFQKRAIEAENGDEDVKLIEKLIREKPSLYM